MINASQERRTKTLFKHIEKFAVIVKKKTLIIGILKEVRLVKRYLCPNCILKVKDESEMLQVACGEKIKFHLDNNYDALVKVKRVSTIMRSSCIEMSCPEHCGKGVRDGKKRLALF